MSDFSVLEHKIIDFFTGSPDPTVQAAGHALANAEAQVVQALPAIGAGAAEAALDHAGPIGQATSPLLGLTIQAVIAALLAKHPDPAAAKAALAAS